MRAIFAALLLVLASSDQAAAQAKCEGDAKSDLELIQKIGSRKAYEAFLDAHKTGPSADVARQQLQQMDAGAKCEGEAKADLELITRIGTRRAYKVFFDAHRTGPCVEIARQQLEQMDPHGITKDNWGDQYFIQKKIDRGQ